METRTFYGLLRGRTSLALLLLVTATVLFVSCGRFYRPSEEMIAERIQTEIAAKTPPPYVVGAKPGSQRIWKMLQRFYTDRQLRPVWTGDHAISAEDALKQMCLADREGLNPANYSVSQISRLQKEAYDKAERDKKVRADRMAKADVAITYSLLTYASHLMNGYARPRWDVSPDRRLLDDIIQAASESGRLEEALKSLAPPHDQYGRLKASLEKYREIATRGGWQPLKPGVSTSGAVAQRLAVTGELPDGIDPATAAPDQIASALRSFQKRNGLHETGRLDEATAAVLNVPVEKRIRLLEINLERWRWLPRELGARYILVNVPSYELQAIENGKTALRMAVVVGQEYKPTPLFSDVMTYLVLNPSWNIPESIIKEEILPILQKDPNYIKRNDMEVLLDGETVEPGSVDWQDVDPENVGYSLRQRPGDGNSLGSIKFVFPNQFNVYLHDTPAVNLFKRAKRDLSHGCVRVSRPVELAEWVLADKPGDWGKNKLEQMIAEGQEQTVKLARPLPVYIFYWTAWAENNGTVSWRDDVYDEDKRLLAALPSQTVRTPERNEACDPS